MAVHYEQINNMLLNEFLKEHKERRGCKPPSRSNKRKMEALTAQVQKVSAQVQVNKPAPQLTANNE